MKTKVLDPETPTENQPQPNKDWAHSCGLDKTTRYFLKQLKNRLGLSEEDIVDRITTLQVFITLIKALARRFIARQTLRRAALRYEKLMLDEFGFSKGSQTQLSSLWINPEYDGHLAEYIDIQLELAAAQTFEDSK